MKGLGARSQLWWGPAVVLVPGLVGVVVGPSAVAWGAWLGDAWQREAGYRWFTAHWLAVNAEHWMVSAMVWPILWTLSPRRLRVRRWGAALALAPWGLSLALFVLAPHHPPYLGSSGLAFAVWTQEALVQAFRGRRHLGWGMLVALAVALSGDWPPVQPPQWKAIYAAAVAHWVHWLGAGWGLVAGLAWVAQEILGERANRARCPGAPRQLQEEARRRATAPCRATGPG